jgi:ABC-type glutathione transport system ATPase component
MHAVSDGERRRVQLCMGLMAPWDILLLDEVTDASLLPAFAADLLTSSGHRRLGYAQQRDIVVLMLI